MRVDSMKNRLITGVLFIFLGGLIALGPQTFFPVCGAHTSEQASEQGLGKMDEHQSMNVKSDEYTGKQASMTTINMVMKCHWTAQAELGIGILIALLGVFLLIFQSGQIRLGLSLAVILNGVLALLIPTALIGVCGSINMTCRSLTLPALTILSSIVIVTSAANVFYLIDSDRKRQVGI